MPEFCSVEREGPLTIVTIERPDVMNSLHPPAQAELAAVFDEFVADPDQWVAIITGAGDRAFSAGNDLKYQASGGKMYSPASGFAGLGSRFDNPKPIIAAVNGIAMGGGFEVALACDSDHRLGKCHLCASRAESGVSGLRRGGIHRLPREIGMKQAMGMLLTGRRVPAEEGRQLGFVNEVVPVGEALNAAKAWAGSNFGMCPLIRAR